MDAVLRSPPSQPQYRRGRSHREFLTSLGELAGDGRARDLERALAVASGAKRKPEAPDARETSLAGELELGKYLNDEWTMRR